MTAFWTLRRTVLLSARRWRLAFLMSVLPAPTEVGASLVQEGLRSDRWSRFPRLRDRYGRDRPDRTLCVRRYDGRLAIDPVSGHVRSRLGVVWGSVDGMGPEREPGLLHYLRRPTFEREAVLLRGAFENNYFHFVYDTMPKVLLADDLVAPDVPLIAGGTLGRQRFFSEAAALGAFGARPVVVQDGRRIRCRSAWVLRPAEPDTAMLTRIAHRFGERVAPMEPIDALYVRRNRRSANGRILRNEDELAATLERMGFLVIDPAETPLARQVQVFRAARLVVSMHGAGLTNIVWRAGSTCRVVELAHGTQVTLDYAYLCAALGYDHTFVRNLSPEGSPSRGSALADIPRILEALGRG